MEQAILDFNKQFDYEPVIENGDVKSANRIALAGMGGSHLAAHLLRSYDRSIPLMVRSDYGLPEMSSEEKKEVLFIASSYSGNTEEVVSFMEMAIQEKLNLIAISTNGRLIDLSEENNIPFIRLPQTGIQPRTAVGFALISLCKAIGRDDVIKELRSLKDILNPADIRKEGEELAKSLENSIPIIYSSTQNRAIAYNWKIKFNETGKIPSFTNVFPELNHNEMAGFDVVDSTRHLSENMKFVFLKDSQDNRNIQKRMDITEKLYQEKGFEVISKEFIGNSRFERIFKSLLLADWTALSLSQFYGTEPEKVSIIEDFKKQL